MPDTIALYLCTWKMEANGARDDRAIGRESVESIDSQRALLRRFAEITSDLTNSTILEYTDENYIGPELQRPAFCRMLEDAKKGRFHILLIQDMSRLSIDENAACGYVQKIFPLLGIRVIVAKTAYDSEKARRRMKQAGMASAQMKGVGANTLEESVFDPSGAAKDYYRGEQSRKIRAGLQAKWKAGKSTASHPPYGYVKDETARGGWAVDPEAARVVQQIFEKAGEGLQVKEIAAYLNGQGIAPPSVYREQKEAAVSDNSSRDISAREIPGLEASGQDVSVREAPTREVTARDETARDASGRETSAGNVSVRAGNQKVAPSECLWDNEKVRSILTRYSYTGANVWKSRSSKGPDSPLLPAEAENGQKIMENAHEAIVTKAQYEKAQAMRQRRSNSRIRVSVPYALRGKVRCGVCRLAMSRVHRRGGDAFFCSHRKYTGEHSECCSEYIPAKLIEQAAQQQFREWQQERESAYEVTSAEVMKIIDEAVRAKSQVIVDEAADTKCPKNAKDTEDDQLFSEMIEPYIDTVYVYTADRIEVIFKRK